MSWRSAPARASAALAFTLRFRWWERYGFREGMLALLSTVAGVEVCGEAATGEDAVRLARELQPDVVLMDLRMPGLGGVEATRAITADAPHIAVLVLTMSDEDASVFASMQAGAKGYLVKGASQAQLVGALEAVASGEAIFGAAVARRMMDWFSAAGRAAEPEEFAELTPRERDVLDLIARGRTNAQIAATLGLSSKTIRNVASSVFTKIRVVDRAQAAVRAREAGFGG